MNKTHIKPVLHYFKGITKYAKKTNVYSAVNEVKKGIQQKFKDLSVEKKLHTK